MTSSKSLSEIDDIIFPKRGDIVFVECMRSEQYFLFIWKLVTRVREGQGEVDFIEFVISRVKNKPEETRSKIGTIFIQTFLRDYRSSTTSPSLWFHKKHTLDQEIYERFFIG